jgi:RNA polymerase sigma factor (TIGR02999 family)
MTKTRGFVPEDQKTTKSQPSEPVHPELTQVLEAAQSGDPRAANNLLEMVYDELRKLARARIAAEKDAGSGMTLQATALVHEAYLRLVTPPGDQPERKPPSFHGRGHFFGAAALAMRRILVERARHRNRIKHGGGQAVVGLDDQAIAAPDGDGDPTDLIAIDEALKKLEKIDPRKGRIVTLRYFAGLSVEETAAAMDLSPATVKNEWAFARAWLHRELSGGSDRTK